MRDDFGITVILVEQNVKRALALGDLFIFLQMAKGVFKGKPDDY